MLGDNHGFGLWPNYRGGEIACYGLAKTMKKINFPNEEIEMDRAHSEQSREPTLGGDKMVRLGLQK